MVAEVFGIGCEVLRGASMSLPVRTRTEQNRSWRGWRFGTWLEACDGGDCY
jgi:hypothetical protein